MIYINKNNKGPKTEPFGTPARILAHLMLSHWVEHIIGSSSNNSELGLD